MVNKTSSRKRRVLLCAAMIGLLGGAVLPAPAYAVITYDAAQAATNAYEAAKEEAFAIADLAKEVAVIKKEVDFFDNLMTGFGLTEDKANLTASIDIMGKELDTAIDLKRADFEIETTANSMFAAERARYAMEHAPPKNAKLCKTIMIHQLVTTTEDFEREISRMAAEAISNRYRCPTCDGSGPDATALIFKQRCEGPLKKGSRLDGNASCYDNNTTATVKGTNGIGFEDADIRAINGSQVYEMPMIQTTTYNDAVTGKAYAVRKPIVPNPADKTKDPQKFWLAALDNLFLLAGTRPTPLSGPAILTPKGMAQRGMFNHCVANQNALIKQCTDLLAFYTRPNFDDPLLQPLRDEQNQRCIAMKDSIDMARFGNCERGLSPYEASLIQQTWCETTQYYMGHVHSGAKFSEAGDSSDICTLSSKAWSEMLVRKQKNCVAAVEALAEMEPCWKAVAALGGGGSRRADAQDSLTKDQAGEVKASAVDRVLAPAKLHRIKVEKKESLPLQGQPISFDEMSLPPSIGQ